MLENCTRIIVGVSGGADSMALLHYLRSAFPGEIIAAHVNHQLRGEESERDELFVRRYCKEHGIELKVHRADIHQLAKKEKKTIEECGRSVRYTFFRSLLQKESDRIATAHTLSDTAETMLFHLARGTGLRGLCGIPPVRDSVIRPLIGIDRKEVEAYCKQNGLSFVQDSTNFSDLYTRNRIRQTIVPALLEINGSALQAMGRLSRQLAEEEEAIAFMAQRAFTEAMCENGYALSVLRRYPKAVVQQGVLEQLRKRCGGNFLTDEKMQRIYQCIATGKGGITITGDLEVRAEQGFLVFTKPNFTVSSWEIPFVNTQIFRQCEKQVKIERYPVQNCKINENNYKFLFHNGLDYGTIPSNAVFRTRRPGDTFRPRGRGITKSLKKMLQESKIPPCRRDQILVLASGSTVLWAEGFGPGQQAAVTAETKEAVKITVEEIN